MDENKRQAEEAETKMYLMKVGEMAPCRTCGKVHLMALTPFPDGEEWPCPYDSSKEAFHVRVAIVIRDDPSLLDGHPSLGSEA